MLVRPGDVLVAKKSNCDYVMWSLFPPPSQDKNGHICGERLYGILDSGSIGSEISTFEIKSGYVLL